MRRSSTKSRSNASKVILKILSSLKKLSCGKTGIANRVRYVDKVFKDLYGVKGFCTRVASSRGMKQAIRIFNEIGVKDLWSLLEDPTYSEVVTLLVEVQERKSELKDQIKKAQKKLASPSIRMDQKSKQNKKINQAQDELRWINKRYAKSIEGLQDSLNIRTTSGDYKDHFSALKTFEERGTITNSYWLDDDPYSYDRRSFNPRNDLDFDDLDFDDLEEEDPRDETIRELQEKIARMRLAMNTSYGINAGYSQNQSAGSPRGNDANVMNAILSALDKLNKRVSELEEYAEDDDDEEYEYGDDQVDRSPGNVSMDQINHILYPNFPGLSDEESPIPEKNSYAPYVVTDPKVAGCPQTDEILKTSQEQVATPVAGRVIDATNREEVRMAPTDYQVKEEPTSDSVASNATASPATT